jgi:hypothetical protein
VVFAALFSAYTRIFNDDGYNQASCKPNNNKGIDFYKYQPVIRGSEHTNETSKVKNNIAFSARRRDQYGAGA